MKKLFAVAAVLALVMSVTACENSNDKSSDNSVQASSVVSTLDSQVESSSSAESSAESSNGEKTELQTVLERIRAEVDLPDDMVDFDERRLKRVFGITNEQVSDFAGAICTDGLKQDEFIFVKAKDESVVEEIAEKLQNDWQSKYNVIKNYDPEQAKIIEDAKVETNGLYVSLVISSEGDKINSIYNDSIK